MAYRNILTSASLAILLIAPAWSEDSVKPMSPLAASEETEAAAPETSEGSAPSVGTQSFDAATVNELFNEYKAVNERRAEEATHLSDDGKDVITLRTVTVQANEVTDLDRLEQVLNPNPQRRLQRLAELDPEAAANIQVSMRSEERFFAGELDPTVDGNAGRTANVDFRKVGAAIDGLVEKTKNATREKKATDNQAAAPTPQ